MFSLHTQMVTLPPPTPCTRSPGPSPSTPAPASRTSEAGPQGGARGRGQRAGPEGGAGGRVRRAGPGQTPQLASAQPLVAVTTGSRTPRTPLGSTARSSESQPAYFQTHSAATQTTTSNLTQPPPKPPPAVAAATAAALLLPFSLDGAGNPTAAAGLDGCTPAGPVRAGPPLPRARATRPTPSSCPPSTSRYACPPSGPVHARAAPRAPVLRAPVLLVLRCASVTRMPPPPHPCASPLRTTLPSQYFFHEVDAAYTKTGANLNNVTTGAPGCRPPPPPPPPRLRKSPACLRSPTPGPSPHPPCCRAHRNPLPGAPT